MSSPSAQPVRTSLRVSDADRDLVTQVLNTAFAEGRITADELDERLTQTLAAKTFGDLEPITADLMPRALATEQYRTVAPSTGAPVVRPGGADSDRIVRVLSDHKRSGAWTLAPHTQVFVALGDVTLDLTQATLGAHRCQISLTLLLGNVKLIVPEGVAVTNKVVTVLGDDKFKGMRPVDANAPTIVLDGMVALGDVTVLGPDHVSLGKRLGFTR